MNKNSGVLSKKVNVVNMQLFGNQVEKKTELKDFDSLVDKLTYTKLRRCLANEKKCVICYDEIENVPICAFFSEDIRKKVKALGFYVPEYTEEQLFVSEQCDHIYHADCVKAQIEFAINNSEFPIKCSH